MATRADFTVYKPTRPRSLVCADDVRGKAVLDRDGDKLGVVDKLIFDERTGHIAYVILSTGGFLGLGQSYHPIPWSVFLHDEKHEGFSVRIDKHILEGAPSYRPDSAPHFDDAYGQRVTDYYQLSSTAIG